MYIVTGGAGFIGSVLVAELNSKGVDDILIVDDLESSGKWQNLVHRNFSDIINKTAFLRAVENDSLGGQITAIIHLGACSSTTERDADYLLENNFHYSRKVAEWSLSHNVRFIYASSAATYGNGANGFSDAEDLSLRLRPLNMYGYSKQLFDLWALKTGNIRRCAGLKFFNVFGPNEYHKGDMSSMVFKAFNQIIATGSIKLFKSYRPEFADGEQKRDFVYVKDCAKIIWWFLENKDANGIFNVGSGAARSWNDLAGAVFAALSRPTNIDYIEIPEAIRGQYQYFTQADIWKLRSIGFQGPLTTFEDSIMDYIRNYLLTDDPYM
jgi:ADP-L-glycero-D-manno-heptose 6-epimerase